jgi:hypothetical protein
MKQFYLQSLLLLALSANAQIGIGTTTPNASAALDITSTTQGLLLPRMTEAQRNLVISPVQGLIVFCTNCGTNGEPQLYNGTDWVNLVGGAAATGQVTYTILDQYTNSVPTGTNYSQLTFYNQYVDAGSIDASPFIITKQTTFEGGILFYGSTELISKSNENTFRLTATTGNFDFISFLLDDLEGNHDDGGTATTIPIITLISSTGLTTSFESTVDCFEDTYGDETYSYCFYYFENQGIITLNWNNVEWVDIKTKYVKAKTKNYVLKTL